MSTRWLAGVAIAIACSCSRGDATAPPAPTPSPAPSPAPSPRTERAPPVAAAEPAPSPAVVPEPTPTVTDAPTSAPAPASPPRPIDDAKGMTDVELVDQHGPPDQKKGERWTYRYPRDGGCTDREIVYTLKLKDRIVVAVERSTRQTGKHCERAEMP